jgi:hypothetical protein
MCRFMHRRKNMVVAGLIFENLVMPGFHSSIRSPSSVSFLASAIVCQHLKALLVRGKQWSAEIGKHDLNVPAPHPQKNRYPPSAGGSIDSQLSSHLHIDQVHFGGMRRKMYLRVIHKQIVHHLNHKEHSFDYKQMTINFQVFSWRNHSYLHFSHTHSCTIVHHHLTRRCPAHQNMFQNLCTSTTINQSVF